MNETSSRKPETNESPKPPSATRLPVTLVGILLLIAASFMYWHDMVESSRKKTALATIRKITKTPSSMIGIRPAPKENQPGIPLPELSREAVAKVNESLAAAEVAELPKNASFDASYDVYLVLDTPSHDRVLFRASRNKNSDDIYFFLKEARRSIDGEISFTTFEPVLTKGLGKVFDSVDSLIRPVRPLVRKAGTYGLTEEMIASTAASLRQLAGFPVASVAFPSEAKADPKNERIIYTPHMDPNTRKQFLQLLQSASDSQIDFSKQHEGVTFGMQLFYPEGSILSLQLAILDSAPEDAYIGIMEQKDASAGAQISSPALVPGLGTLLAPVRERMKKHTENAE